MCFNATSRRRLESAAPGDPMKLSPLLAVLATGTLLAQRPPLPGIPVMPVTDHPALAAQPLMQPKPTNKPSTPPAPPEGATPEPTPIDPDTFGPQIAGKGLADAIANALALPWHTKLATAQAEAATTGKPILWLQALGTLDGRASSALQSLRGTTFGNAHVLAELREHFVVGRADLERAPHVGLSLGYEADQTAMGTTNGAGGRNVQILVLAADGTLVHALPGYWHALDLLPELDLARQLHSLYGSTAHTREQKEAMARVLQKGFARNAHSGLQNRTRWRDVDAAIERERGRAEPRDTCQVDAKGKPVVDAKGILQLKPLLQVVHERLAARPFVALASFDMEAFVDYGTPLHDDNAAVEAGQPFPGAVQNQQRRERERKAGKKP